MRAAIELIDDLEDRLLALLGRGVQCESHSDSQMGLSAQFWRNERIGCFLDAVVKEPIRIFGAEDQAGSDRFPKPALQFLVRSLVHHLQEAQLGAAAQARELP